MSTFRDSLGRPGPEPDELDDADVTLGDVEDAQFVEEATDEFNGVETASYEEVTAAPAATGSAPPRKRGVWLVFAAVAVALVVFAAAVSGGSGDDDGGPATPAVTPAPVSPTKPAKPKPATPAPVSRSAESLVAAAEALLHRWDHAADGKRGVLVNSSERVAALMSKELGVPVVTSGRPKRGELYLKLERRVGFAIVYAMKADGRTPLIKQVDIVNIGVNAGRG